MLEDEIAIANIKEEIGLGDQEGDEQLPFEFWIDALKDILYPIRTFYARPGTISRRRKNPPATHFSREPSYKL